LAPKFFQKVQMDPYFHISYFDPKLLKFIKAAQKS